KDLPLLTREAFRVRSHCKTEADALKNAETLSMKDAAPKITCPIFIVTGRQDRLVPASPAERRPQNVPRAGPPPLLAGGARQHPPVPVSQPDGRLARGAAGTPKGLNFRVQRGAAAWHTSASAEESPRERRWPSRKKPRNPASSSPTTSIRTTTGSGRCRRPA